MKLLTFTKAAESQISVILESMDAPAVAAIFHIHF